ncbi:hypothetical protein NUM3379_31110 [Kineococcus sp. NUM-3379]
MPTGRAGPDGARPGEGHPGARHVHDEVPPGDGVLYGVLAGVVLALVVTVAAGPRAGGVVLGADLLVAAVLRLVLPVRVAGALAVRSRGVDVVVLLALAAACAGLAWVVPTTA